MKAPVSVLWSSVKALGSLLWSWLWISVGWFILSVVAVINGELVFAAIAFLLSAGFAGNFFREQKRLRR
jgi:membrane protein DedA with SNARE-associated domain